MATAVVIVALCCIFRPTEGWSIVQQQQQQVRRADIIPLVESIQRRNLVSSIIGTTATTFGITTSLIVAVPSRVEAAAPTNQKVNDAINELKESRDKLKDIPDLLEAKEWDKVRSILKVPPVNKLWNLGDVRFFLAGGLLERVIVLLWKSYLFLSIECANALLIFCIFRLFRNNISVLTHLLCTYQMFIQNKVTKYSIDIGERNGEH